MFSVACNTTPWERYIENCLMGFISCPVGFRVAYISLYFDILLDIRLKIYYYTVVIA